MRRDKDPPAPTYGPDLADLIATERRLEQELADARAEAEALVAAARASAATSNGEHEAALRVRRVELDAEIEAHVDRRIAALTSLTGEHIARLDAIEGARLEGVARRLGQVLLTALARGESP